MGATSGKIVRAPSEGMHTHLREQIDSITRHLFEPQLDTLNLSIEKLLKQNAVELEISLATVRSAMLKPEGFGVAKVALQAQVGTVIVKSHSEAHLEVTILPILLQREQFILERKRLLEERSIVKIDDLLARILDNSLRKKMQDDLMDLRIKAAQYEKESYIPKVFIGSSSEGLRIAESIQFNLRNDAHSVIWSQGVFGLSSGTLESLISIAPTFQYAILVITPDDLVTSRRRRTNSPRDNVLFEAGLFMGVLGRKATFLVCPSDATLKLPSDLAGISMASFKRPPDGNLAAALGPACTEIRNAMGVV